MSQYLNIFLKSDGKFIPIRDYSRSTYLYDEFHAPYEKIREYKADELREIGACLESRANSSKNYIQELKSLIALIPNFQGQEMEEKISAILDYKSQIEEEKEELKTLHFQISVCYFLASIAEDYVPVYAGVEIADPTDQDVI
jgi:hypothetical protein